MKKNKKKSKQKRRQPNKLVVYPFLLLIIGFGLGAYFYSNQTEEANVVKKYYRLLDEKKYEEIYGIVQTDLDKDAFVQKLSNIYEGIEAKNISVTILSNSFIRNLVDNETENNEIDGENEPVNISYKVSFNTIAGDMDFKNKIPVLKEGEECKIQWDFSMIFPDLKENEKVRVRTLKPKRGTLYDRNDNVLAKESSVYEIAVVPDKIADNGDVYKIAKLLDLDNGETNNILKKLDASSDYVFVKRIHKEEQDLKNQLLRIKGVVVNDVEARVYPYKDCTSIMTGYVQDGDGKSGLEYSFNTKLKGEDGIEIYIENDGLIKKSLIKKDKKDGDNVKVTIDVDLQKRLYDLFKDDNSVVVALDYKTGEVKTLLSTPSYDANAFSLGFSQEQWNELQEDSRNPLFNRYLSSYAPGSTMKPIIGAVGLECNAFTSDEDFGTSGRKWQKDSSWGNFWVTTLKEYSEPADLKNALIQSDNIYFAKAALKIGRDNLENGLNRLGFNSRLDFVQEVDVSTYGELDDEKTIANTGFGQAKVMVNPVQMASFYSCFANSGDMINPYLEFEDNDENKTKFREREVISKETADCIKECLIQVVENGSGCVENKVLAGKTGTAEIKSSQDDKNGSENGWFVVFDEDGNLYVAMVEDVKQRGGSKYVVEKMKEFFENE